MTEPIAPSRDRRTPSDGRDALVRLATGVVLIMLAVLVYAVSRFLASGQEHSYDAGASPPTTVRLIAGKQYQLSTPVGVSTLRNRGQLDALSCYWSEDGNLQNPLQVQETLSDDRDLHTFATVIAPSTGRQQIGCTGIDKVFVDDAEDSGRDTSAAVVLLSVLVGTVGVPLAVSGWYRLPPLTHYHDSSDDEDDEDDEDDQDVDLF
ncbi:MAG TPA: hypothetical protein VH298_15445 [Jatrophihabitans sp.]|nr:hypothetical protein [Jatrophihabitans sp.]